MVTSTIALMLIMFAAFGFSGLTNRRAEECLPVCFCGMIAFLYGFYCFGVIRLGLPIFCIGCVTVFLAAWRKQKSLRALFSKTISPGIVVYLGLAILFLAFFSGNYVTRHDELRLWAAVPKAIHATGELQMGEKSPVFSIMQSYPPGLPLLETFFTAFCTVFSEGALYVGYACFAAAFLLPAMSMWDWKLWPLMAPAGLILLLTPCVFTSHFGDGALFGMTLFVDPLLGIAAGYVFFLASQKPFRDGFHIAEFTLGLLVLCLLKNTGVFFGITALISAVLLDARARNLRLLYPIAAVLASVGGWKLLQGIYNVHDLVQLQIHTLDGNVIRNVLQALVSINMIAYRVPLGFLLSFVSVFVILLALYYLVFRLGKAHNGRETFVIAIGILLSTVVFIYGYALIYGQTLESFPRYMSTPLLCLFSCTLLTAFPLLSQTAVVWWLQRQKKILKISACCGSILLGLVVLTVWCRVFPTLDLREAADRDAERIRIAIQQDDSYDGSGWIYLVMAGDGLQNSHYHHRIYFDLISKEMNIRNGLAQTQVVIPGRENPASEWAEELQGGYDYVYLLSLEDALIPVFAELSEDIPEENCLYRVCKADTKYGITLKAVP